MSLIIQYCESCGDRIAAEAIESGQALLYKDCYYCSKCGDKLIAEHPELGLAAQRQDSRRQTDRERRPSVLLDASDTRRLGRPATTRQPAGPRPTAGQRGNRPSAETARRVKPATKRAEGPPIPLIIGGIVGVVVIAVVAMQLNSRKDLPKDLAASSVAPSSLPSSVASSSSEPDFSSSPTAPNYAADFERVRQRIAQTPGRYQEHLAFIQELLDRTAGSDLGPKVTQLFERVTQEQEQAAQKAFESTRREIEPLLASRSYDQAIDRWRQFDDQLETTDIRRMILTEIENIRQLKVQVASSSASTPASTTPQQPLQVPIPQVPGDGELVDLLGPRGRWGNLGQAWQRVGNEFVVSGHPSEAVIFATKDNGATFSDFYMKIEFKVDEGAFVFVAPAAPPGSPQQPTRLGSTQGGWQVCHVVVVRGTTWVWVTGDNIQQTQAQQRPASAESGPVVLAASPGARVTVRKIEMLVQRFGPPMNAPASSSAAASSTAAAGQLPVPNPAKQRALIKPVDEPGSGSWRNQGGSWLGAAIAGGRGLMQLASSTSRRYVLRFAFRNVNGEMLVLIHQDLATQQSARIRIPTLQTQDWISVVIVVDDRRIQIFRIVNGQAQAPDSIQGPEKGDQLVISLPAGSSIELRDATIEPLEP